MTEKIFGKNFPFLDPEDFSNKEEFERLRNEKIEAEKYQDLVEKPDFCFCGKCEVPLVCQHDGDEHEVSLCGNCV